MRRGARPYPVRVTRTRDHGLLSDLASLLLCGLLAGVVIAAAAFPAVAVAGLTAKAGTDSFENLPSELKTPLLPQTSTLLAADNSLITKFYGDENRTTVALAKIPVPMQKAMLAAEDSRFYDHQGVDIKGVVRAFIANQQAGKVTQGASTLTQQYVKLVLQQNATSDEEREAASAQTNVRKLREMRYAIALEKRLSKDQILENYLNIAFFGNRGYGVQQAAAVYFSKPLDKLTLSEAALLAGLVQSPTEYNPTKADKQPALDRRNYVLTRIGELGYAPQAEVDAAKKLPIALKPAAAQRSCGNIAAARRDYGFFCEYFLDWWSANPQFGRTPEERMEKLNSGGYVIRSSIDPRIQQIAQETTDREMRTRNIRIAGGVVMVEPGTGRVKAMAVNRTYDLNQKGNPRHPLFPGQKANYPNTVVPLLSGSDESPGYAAGSTFKMFAMVAALERGMPLNTTLVSPDQYVVRSKRSNEPGNCGGFYCTSNASKSMAGTHTMWSGFGRSVNTYFIQLQEMVGIKAVVDTADKMGITFRGGDRALNSPKFFIDNQVQSFVFGQGPRATPLEVASAYATLAARGKACDPTAAVAIVGPDGKVVKGADAKCRQVIPADIADAATDAARCPVNDRAQAASCGGSGTGGPAGALVDRPLAGKTGSTPGNKAVWMAGYTPNLAAASFVTNPDNPEKDNANAYQSAPKQIFGKAMQGALSQMPVKQFVRPTPGRAFGIQVTMPDVDGRDVGDAQATLEDAGFRVRVGGQVNSFFERGRVASTNPRGGGRASKGGVVTIYVSNGKPPVETAPVAPATAGPKVPPRRNRPRPIFPPRRPVLPPRPR